MSEEKTGGTPHGGRLAPGKEGKGKCRRQRFPEIHAKPTGELKKLIDQAYAVADHLGHQRLELWRVEDPGEGNLPNAAQVRCQDCHKVCGIALHPMYEKIYRETPQGPQFAGQKQKEKINGPLVTERCPA